MKFLLNILTATIFFLHTQILNSQDVHFSQLFADKLYLNPAYAGTDYCPRILLSYRNQWPGLDFPFVTYATSFDKYSESMNGGIGIRIMKDEQGSGVFNQVSIDLIYSYHARLGQKSNLRFAFEASAYQKSMNTGSLIFSNMIDPLLGVIYPNAELLESNNFFSPDFSAGLLFNYSNYFLGIAASHIPQNIAENHNEILPLKLTGHIGCYIPIDRKDSKQSIYAFEPNLIYIRQLNSNLFFYGTYFDIREMSFGLFMRQVDFIQFDAIVASFHLRVKKMTLGYSFDMSLSKLLVHGWGAHELSLSFILPCDKKIRNYNTISCPSF